MNIITRFFGSSLALAAVLSGCASQPNLSHEQIMSQHEQVANLDSALQKARAKNAELLAPVSYEKANSSLQTAISAAEDGESQNAETAAKQGLKTIDKLNRDTENSRVILSEALQARDRAYSAGAATTQKNKIEELDEELKETATLVEKGNSELAKQRRSKLIAGYSKLELEALKLGTANLAKSAIANAKQQGADDYAPISLARAEEQMALAATILDADRTQTSKAEKHAKQAKWYAEQSAAITETIKDFERRDYTKEDIVLWQQQQLSIVNQPLGLELPFNQSNEKAAESLRNAVSNLVDEGAQLKATEQKVGKQLAVTEKQRQAMLQKEREEQQRFDTIQAMFDSSEANVYRQRQNVLISAHGFSFPSGQSEIQAGNFPLMNKITRAIKTFPNARVEVNGHTDSLGNEKINQSLSNARAQKVAKFLVDLGGIESNRISSRGFGELRPVASNETKTGRAENRRVEIKIINE